MFPGTQRLLPGTQRLLPGKQRLLPGEQWLLPTGQQSLLPGQKRLIPTVQQRLLLGEQRLLSSVTIGKTTVASGAILQLCNMINYFISYPKIVVRIIRWSYATIIARIFSSFKKKIKPAKLLLNSYNKEAN